FCDCFLNFDASHACHCCFSPPDRTYSLICYSVFSIWYEHSRHRSCWNFLVNLMAGLIAYTYQPKLPSLDLQPKGLSALPPAIF
ncbi:hypothetical protein NDI36_29785, partial [Leptolyngbya boryana FACHB-1624]